jgi:hypothetical protein
VKAGGPNGEMAIRAVVPHPWTTLARLGREFQGGPVRYSFGSRREVPMLAS